MTTVEIETYPVTLYDGDDANGVASIVGMLIGQNVENFPSRVKFARKISRPCRSTAPTPTAPARSCSAPTRQLSTTTSWVGRASPSVPAWTDLDVSQLPMKAGGLIPVGFFTNRGMKVLGGILTHKLVVKGLLTHTLTALRTIALVSVVES